MAETSDPKERMIVDLSPELELFIGDTTEPNTARFYWRSQRRCVCAGPFPTVWHATEDYKLFINGGVELNTGVTLSTTAPKTNVIDMQTFKNNKKLGKRLFT